MTRQSRPRDPAFTYESVMEEIGRFVREEGRGTKKRLAAAAGVPQPDFRAKMIQRKGARFSIEQLGRIGAEANVGPGWPFVTRRQAAILAAIEEEKGQNRK